MGILLSSTLKDVGMKLALVNFASVKKAKEVYDNNPEKKKTKDLKVIVKFAIDERYSFQ